MAEAEHAKPGEDDGALLAVEVTEPVVLQEPDRATAMPEQAASADPLPPPKRRSGLLGFVLGGAVVAAAGFAAATYVWPDPSTGQAIAALQTEVEATKATDAALRSDLAALAERPTADAGLEGRIAALESARADGNALGGRLTALEDRLTAIEASSASGDGPPAAAMAAMARDIAALKAAVAAQQASGPALTADVEAAAAAAQTRLDAAEAAAETAAKQAALSHIRAAFESGAPLGPALDGLKAIGAELPAALTAEGAVPTLQALQASFDEPARAALDAAIRADMGDAWSDRLTSFLRTQSGVRSLTPRDGTDPDAVLSRAEAALHEGQLQAALTELTALPPAGVEAMAPWVAEATKRLTAEQAITDLSATLNGQ